jgi:hypothetical protein
MVAHAKLSASGAHRWMACPGSINAEDGLADRSSFFAEEGTKAHFVMENALTNGKPCSHYADKGDTEMAEHVQTYVDYVHSLQKAGDAILVEHRVDFSEWVPGGFGTADTIIFGDDWIHIVDFKYGKGVQVYVQDNPQPLLYGLGAFYEFSLVMDIKKIRMSIVQPRLDHIDEWEISVTDLLKFGEKARQAAEATTDPKAPRVPGEKQCKFCKAKATCPALYKLTTETLLADFEQIDEAPQPHKLTEEQMRKALENRIMIEAWLLSVENFAKERIASGKGFPGFKLVEGRSTRHWSDDGLAGDILEYHLGEAAFTKKMISPAQAEKLIGKTKKALIQDLIVKPPGKPSLARESDPRPEIKATISDFEALDDSENEA